MHQLEKTVANAIKQAQTKLDQLFNQAFACEADALAALSQLQPKLPWHDLEDPNVTQRFHYAKAGKPKVGSAPDRISYQVKATLKLNSAILQQYQTRAGRFILATN